MKTGTIIQLIIALFITPLFVSCLALPQQQAQAQENISVEPSGKYSREELAQMLAPIALYPDTLLTQVLMASTYPIEIIEADRWVKKNPELKNNGLDEALLSKDWDPSVKAICHFPSILALMSERISETTTIGNAFLAQEDEVMNMIQELRAKAHAQGNLTTNSEQKVIVEKETIIIEPANPQVIYVPYYDPAYIYGPWWYPAYPPYYWGPAGVNIGIGISYWPGFYFGFAFGSWSYFDWPSHFIYIDIHKRPRYVRSDYWGHTPNRWQHAPVHRRGVAYRDKFTARKYGQYPTGTTVFRPEVRGYPEQRQQSRDRDQHFNNLRENAPTGQIYRQPETERTVPTKKQPEFNKPRQQVAPETRGEQPGAGPGSRVLQPPNQTEQQKQQILPHWERITPKTREEQPAAGPGSRMQQQRNLSEQQIQQVPQDRERIRIETQQQQRSRDNVFNQVDNGRLEKQSSERGQFSRQRMWNDNLEGRSPGGTGRSGNGEGGRRRR